MQLVKLDRWRLDKPQQDFKNYRHQAIQISARHKLAPGRESILTYTKVFLLHTGISTVEFHPLKTFLLVFQFTSCSVSSLKYHRRLTTWRG